jgi:hypothetical protein
MTPTAADKKRVTDDEMRRLVILQNAKTKQPMILAFFNSPLGIWFLSSIVVSLISWQYCRYVERQENFTRTAAHLSKSKFDLLILCDIGLSLINDKTKLSYNDISSAAALFRYYPGIPEVDHRFSIVEVLNEIAFLSSNDIRVATFRKRSYGLLLKANTVLSDYRGWQSCSDTNASIYDVKLADDQKKVIFEIKVLLEEMRSFADDAINQKLPAGAKK